MSIFVHRPPIATLSPLFSFPVTLSSRAARRHESTSRRTTKALRVKPDLSYTASLSPSQVRDHIVFNPPASAPSPYQTPAAFLPPNDPRRELLSQSHQHANPYSDPGRRLPPAIRQAPEKKYHLGEEEIAQIRALRLRKPAKWTQNKLAEVFECSPFFIGMVCRAPKPQLEKQKRALERVKEKWGQKRSDAREDRQKRKELWGRDE